MAWHDQKWNGNVCNDPSGNVYCRGNYSLLSPRIQRRIDLDLEDEHKNEKLSQLMSKEEYLPPCFWSINLQGDGPSKIEEGHPFFDIPSWRKQFASVPFLRDTLQASSVYTWCFKLGYAAEASPDRYRPPEELKQRVDDYLSEIRSGSSIAFFYCNYSNPVTGDDYKYLVLGAGVVKKTSVPDDYSLPKSLLEEIRAGNRMENFPTQPWHFQVNLDSKTVFVLPYQEYVNRIGEATPPEANDLWSKLNEVAIPVLDRTLIRHFKYVSMHVSHDKAIYLLCQMDKSLRKMKEHGVVGSSELNQIQSKIESLLAIAWKERGRYPGFRNAVCALLSENFRPEYIPLLTSKLERYLEQNGKSHDELLEKSTVTQLVNVVKGELSPLLRAILTKFELVKFFSQFDFSITQFKNLIKMVNQKGILTLKRNPYLIMEAYNYDFEDNDWNIDNNDYSIDLYNIDIALIPDAQYASWEPTQEVQSPERIRAVISKILTDAQRNGHSCLLKDDIVELSKEYPLFFITDQLELDLDRLSELEKGSLFKERFDIKQGFGDIPTVYQLREIRDIELIIERFVDQMEKKQYTLNDQDIQTIDDLVKSESSTAQTKLDPEERRNMYRAALSNGLFVLSGKAGSGKTSAVVNLIGHLKNSRKVPIFVFTPTGKANLVIRQRLKKLMLHNNPMITVSTIHRFLFTRLLEAYQSSSQWRSQQFGMSRIGSTRWDISRLQDLVKELLEGKFGNLETFRTLVKGYEFRPKVVIIDEASMVDETLLACLFALVRADQLEHLIIVGDERQLPPIGIGRPFIDTIYHLKKSNLDDKYARLTSNLRFEATSRLGTLSELFGGDTPPSPAEIEEVLQTEDSSLKVHTFEGKKELRKVLESILRELGAKTSHKNLQDLFSELFETGGSIDLDKIQIITPRRTGDFGSVALNLNIVRDGTVNFEPGSKLICEDNLYFDVQDKGKRKRIIGLANGSIGCIKADGNVHFDDIADLEAEYGQREVWPLVRQVTNAIQDPYGIEKSIDFGYSITVHKSQGSDFEYVVLVIPEMSSFTTRELLYTALTRPRVKLHIVVREDLSKELPTLLAGAWENSAVEPRNTRLFQYKFSPFKPYLLTLKNGRTIYLDSKIERLIAKTLDQLDVPFEAGVKEFLEQYRVKPDFRVDLGKIYYWEHLGNMKDFVYRNRWFKKFDTYKKLGVAQSLVTSTESLTESDVEANVRKIVEDMKLDKLRQTEGEYSYHHYSI